MPPLPRAFRAVAGSGEACRELGKVHSSSPAPRRSVGAQLRAGGGGGAAREGGKRREGGGGERGRLSRGTARWPGARGRGGATGRGGGGGGGSAKQTGKRRKGWGWESGMLSTF